MAAMSHPLPSPPAVRWLGSFLRHSTPLGAYPANEDDAPLVHVCCGLFLSSELRRGWPGAPGAFPEATGAHVCQTLSEVSDSSGIR